MIYIALLYLVVGVLVVMVANLSWKGSGPNHKGLKLVLEALCGEPIGLVFVAALWPVFALVWLLRRK